jgi:hypothetical protein
MRRLGRNCVSKITIGALKSFREQFWGKEGGRLVTASERSKKIYDIYKDAFQKEPTTPEPFKFLIDQNQFQDLKGRRYTQVCEDAYIHLLGFNAFKTLKQRPIIWRRQRAFVLKGYEPDYEFSEGLFKTNIYSHYL